MKDIDRQLVEAILENDPANTQILIAQGADVNAMIDEVIYNPTKMQSLIDQGVDVDTIYDEKNYSNDLAHPGYTVFMLATYLAHLECYSILVENGADIDRQSVDHGSALQEIEGSAEESSAPGF
jgi:hypothetical protein